MDLQSSKKSSKKVPKEKSKRPAKGSDPARSSKRTPLPPDPSIAPKLQAPPNPPPPIVPVFPAMPTTAAKKSSAVSGNTATDNSSFKVKSGYDDGFLKSSKVTTITDLLYEGDTDLSHDFVTAFQDSDVVEPTFLHGILLKVSPPSANQDGGSHQFVPYKSGARFGKKFKAASNFKKSLLFGDLEDPKAPTFVVLETSNNIHNLLFRDRTMDDVVVGTRFAIKSPELVGKFKSGSYIIKTDRPFEILVEPKLPSRALDASKVSDSLRFFVLVGKKVAIQRKGVVSPIQTLCNGRACDRLQAAKSPTAPCGCWNQSSRCDTLAKNTVLKLAFKFKDSTDQVVQVTDFTSLKWSRSLFHSNQILADCSELLDDAVFQELQTSFRKVLTHVNDNGGWTIVGWFKRASEGDDDDKQDTEQDLLRETVRLNISHLAPSTEDGLKIPDDYQLKQSTIRKLLDNKGTN